MTRAEAKAILENDIVDGHVEGNSKFMDAFWMAVDALEYDDAKYHEEHGEVIVAKELWEDAERALRAIEDIKAEILEETECHYGDKCLGANCPSNTDCMIMGEHAIWIIDKHIDGEKSCIDCKFWLLDKDDKNRRCRYCVDMDEWISGKERR